MNRPQKLAAALVGALLLAVPAAWGLDQVGLREPLRLLQAMAGTSGTFTGTLSVGVLDAGTLVTGPTTANGDLYVFGDAGVSGKLGVDGYASLRGDAGVNILSTTGDVVLINSSSQVRFGGPTGPGFTYGGATTIQGAGSTAYASPGLLSAQGNFQCSGAVSNPGSGGGCSGNLTALCIDDLFAGTNGAGLTMWNFTATGTLSLDGGLNVGDGTGTPWAQIGPDGLARLDGGTCLGPGCTVIPFACDTGAQTINFGSILMANCADSSALTLDCATTTSKLSLGVPNAAMVAGSMFQAWVNQAGQVTVRHCCIGAATCDPGSGAFYVEAFGP